MPGSSDATHPGFRGFRDRALFRPNSVILVGDPCVPEAAILAQNLAAGGFHGRLFSLGLDAPGLEPVCDIASLPIAPDLAVFALPPSALGAAMAALAERGCTAGVVAGAAPDLGAITARTGLRALGPFSFGVAVPAIGLNATLSRVPPRAGKLALVGQSSALTRSVLDWADAEAVGFSHVIGIGGNATTGFAVSLDWLARDAATGAVLLELRRVRDRRAVISAARAVARTRPVVALRAGGRLADPSGVGDAVMAAALRRAGVLRVGGLGDLLGAAETLARARLRPGTLTGDRVAIVANALGPALLAADAVLACGLRLAPLSQETLGAIDLRWPARPAGNPLVVEAADPTILGEAAAMLATVPEADIVVALHAPTATGADAIAAATLAAAAKAGRGRLTPLLLGWAGGAAAAAERAALSEAGLAVFETPEAAVRGAAHLAEDRRNRAAAAELPARDVLDLTVDRPAVRRIFARVRAAGRLALDEEEALAVLAAYGIPAVPGRAAASADDAAIAAGMLGFPVVLKILSPDITHKSEVGGVTLGLGTAAAVRDAAIAMQRRVAARRPDARLDGFLVQRQAGRGIELRLRLGDEAMFGPWIGFGEGGTAADLAGDAAFELPPLNLALAQGLIGRSRMAALLDGFRERPAANRPAVAETLVRLSQLAIDWPEIASLVINPLFADAHGVLAVDAECQLRPPGELGLTAIAPYPAELARPFTTRAGSTLLVRPIRPEDATAHAALFARLPAEDIRFRFFSPLKELPPVLTARLTQIDYDREMAFVALLRAADGSETAEGVSRLIRSPGDAEEAEFAVIVSAEMKGQGLARHLMQRLFDWGASVGVRRVVGQVLADNAPMLAFVRALGFAVRRSTTDDDIMEAVLDLSPRDAGG